VTGVRGLRHPAGGVRMVAQSGVEPETRGYEPQMIPFHHRDAKTIPHSRAMIKLALHGYEV
jgi:hypothetical protein